jgi:hypothetical protein
MSQVVFQSFDIGVALRCQSLLVLEGFSIFHQSKAKQIKGAVATKPSGLKLFETGRQPRNL